LPLRRLQTGFISLLALAGACTATDKSRDRPLGEYVAAQMEELHIPGLVAAAVDSGQVVWVGTYGFANVADGQLTTDTTPFMIASVSKTITATVLMSLRADGAFGLDDDINDYLPFPVRNPNHPTVPITFRQLLRHRSSLADNAEFYEPYWSEATGDPTTSLESYLRNYLAPDGAHYDPEKNFLESAPNEVETYCNTCYALLGLLAEEIAGVPFERLSQEVLFTPLEMTSTGWFLRDFEAMTPAMPYRHAADTGYVAYGQNGYPDWPAGQLRTTITDLARFLSVYSWGGRFKGQAVIDPSTIDTLTPVDSLIAPHTWFEAKLRNGRRVYTHGGGDIGVRTVATFDPVGGRGVVVLTNGEAPVQDIAEEIYLAIDSLKALPTG